VITLWNPTTQAFEAGSGDVSPSQMLLNILIEMRVQSFILGEMNKDVLKDEVATIRADMATDTPNFVTGAIGPLTS
jgi:hypothetical protein